jgi:hypothetical protein
VRLILIPAMILSMVITAGVGTAVVAGRERPVERLAVLRFGECPPPCWVGVMPGETSLNDAIARLKVAFANDFEVSARMISPNSNHYAAGAEVELVSRTGPGFTITVMLDARAYDAPLRSLTFAFYGAASADFSLHALLSVFGTPSDVVVRRLYSNSYRRLLLIRYTDPDKERGVMIMAHATSRIEGEKEPYRVQFFDFGRFVTLSYWRSRAVPWQGMARLNAYTEFSRQRN